MRLSTKFILESLLLVTAANSCLAARTITTVSTIYSLSTSRYTRTTSFRSHASRPTSLPPSTPSTLAFATPSPTPSPINITALKEVPRLVIYFQTTHNATTGKPISMLPLITEQHIALTHLIVCSLHVHANGTIHLNDYPPSHPIFHTLWNETAVLKTAGVRIMGMIGGAAPGSFSRTTLDAPPGSEAFETAYGLLTSTIRTYGLEGLDIDVEQPMSQAGISYLIRRLRADFGPQFIISLAPVASALRRTSSGNLSGFNYHLLEQSDGANISFYNAQFYNGFGDMGDGKAYGDVLVAGWKPAKILVGQLTSPRNGGQYVDFVKLNKTVVELRNRLAISKDEFGGIAGWEYFNGEPGGEGEPWKWAQLMTYILWPFNDIRLTVTKEVAEGLLRAWRSSFVAAVGEFVSAGVGGGGGLKEEDFYLGMVNA